MPFGLPFELALVLGWVSAVLVHFTLQRFFVWVHRSEFALNFASQVGRYLVVACVQYAVTAPATAVISGALDVPVIAVFYATAIGLSVLNFLIYRGGVFHAQHP